MEDDNISIYSSGKELPEILRGLTAARLLSIIDMAEGGDTRELFALYRDIIASDSHIQSEFAKRKGAVLSDTIALMPYDKAKSESLAARDKCAHIIEGQPFSELITWLLNATLYPVAVAEKVYRPTATGYTLEKIVPVPYRLLSYNTGTLRIIDTDNEGREETTSHTPDPVRYIVHRGHVMPLPDTWGGPMRAILFWWLLKTMSRQWWADLLERFGMPFLKGKFSDDQGKRTLAQAFSMAQRLGGIVISKNTEVEIGQATTGDSANSHERFVEACNKEISRLILGSTLASTAEATGMGSGTAELQGRTKDDLRKQDARLLAQSIRVQLLTQYLNINGIYTEAPRLTFGSDSDYELATLMGLVSSLATAGLEPDDDALATISERVGFGIRRRAVASPESPFALHALSSGNPPSDNIGGVEGSNSIRNSELGIRSSKLADKYAERVAAIAEIVSTSESAGDCLRRVREYLEKNPAQDAAELLQDAMTAYAEAR